MSTTLVRLFCFLALLSSAQSQASLWDGSNDPAIFDAHFNYHYSTLPKSGRLTTGVIPWSETFWSAKKGSINLRWNSPSQDAYHYTPPTREEVAQMSRAELAQLSPSEKYDIYMGNYQYPIWSEVASSWANPRESDWAGMCDGWSAAAIQYKEPQAVDLKNKDGIVVPFGSSDVKGLMAFSASAHFKVETKQVGARCFKKPRHGRITADCDDVNAGAMHVIFANMIGIQKRGFVMDRDPGPEIWNQPVLGFEFKEVGSTENGVQMHGTVIYVDELDNSMYDPVTGTKNAQETKLEMDYTLDLDDAGNIVGGDWMEGSDHPDFLWIPTNHLTFDGVMAGVNTIYKPIK
jgi:hypothetical protein